MKRWLFTTAAAAAFAAGPARADDATANVTVTVPVGASLTIDGKRTEQMTAVRQFVTPPLAGGQKYTYTLQASYTWNGKAVTKEQKVEVWGGATVAVDMMAAHDAPPAAGRPAPGSEPEP